MQLFYGQIRPTNYQALLKHYGHEPPWPMADAPHLSLVQAHLERKCPQETAYFRYLRHDRTPGDALRTLEAQDAWVHRLLRGSDDLLRVDIEHESVLDGNHRAAVALGTGRPMIFQHHAPYQTLEFPDGREIPGRRLPLRGIPYDLSGKTVLDLGCAHGMMSITALRQDAAHVTAVEGDLRSTTWQMRDAWGFTEKMRIIPSRIEDLEVQDVDVVLAYSVVRHVDPAAFERLVRGRVCVLETHSEGEPPPVTAHHWVHEGYTPYSRAEPKRRRDIYVGTPM